MERDVAMGNRHNLYGPSRDTDLRKPGVIEKIKESDGPLINFQDFRLERSAEYLRKQFGWSTSIVDLTLLTANVTR